MKKLITLLIIIIIFISLGCKEESKSDIATNIKKINVLLPQTPSSLPTYFALKDNSHFSIDFFLNHSQANAKFLRGDAQLLLTGISVANSFSSQGVEFDLISSHVDNLTHLVSNQEINSLADLKNQTIVFPFADSPMELLFTAIAEKNKLFKNQDYSVQYNAFDTSLQLLQQGSDLLVWLPEPFASLAENKFDLKVSLSLNQLFIDNLADFNATQVVLLSKDLDLRNVASLNYLTKVYIDSLRSDPERFISSLPQDFPNRQAYTPKTIIRTSYFYLAGEDLNNSITKLYNLIDRKNYLAERVLDLN